MNDRMQFIPEVEISCFHLKNRIFFLLFWHLFLRFSWYVCSLLKNYQVSSGRKGVDFQCAKKCECLIIEQSKCQFLEFPVLNDGGAGLHNSNSGTHSESIKTSQMELISKIVNGWKSSIIFAKKLHLNYLTGFWYMPPQLLQHVITAHTNIDTYFQFSYTSCWWCWLMLK